MLKYVYWNDETGYGVAAKQYIKALEDTGVGIILAPMRRGSGLGLGYEPEPAPGWHEPSSNLVIHTVPEYYPHLLPELSPRTPGKKYAATIWETSHIPPGWPAMINMADEIIVPTQWNKDLFRTQGIQKPIHVVPIISQFEGKAMAGSVYEQAVMDIESSLKDLKGRFIFYSIGMWIPRKGLEGLLEAFAKAFTRRDPVALVIKTSDLNYGKKSSWRRLIHGKGRSFQTTAHTLTAFKTRYPDSPPVKLFNGYWNDERINALHQAGDAYISLAKAEGWGMGVWEAAWFSKPLIVTESLGFLRDMQGPGPGMVPYEMKQVANDEPRPQAFYREWTEPVLDDAVDIMRDMVKRPHFYQTEAQKRKTYLENHFCRGRIAKIFKEVVQA